MSPTGDYISRVSSRQTRNFGFGQSSQSHLRLRHRPQKPAGALRASSSQGVQASHIPCAWPGRAPCCASLSLLLLASPGLAVRGEPVRRDEGPLDLRLDPLHPFRARSGPTSLSSRRFPASLERPGFAIRGEPARRGGDSPDRRLLSGSPLGAWLGERRPKNTTTKAAPVVNPPVVCTRGSA